MGDRVGLEVVRRIQRRGRHAAPTLRRALRSASAVGAIAATLLLGASSPASAVGTDPVLFDLSGGGDFGPTGTIGGSDCTVSSPASCLSHTDSTSGLTLTLSARTLIPDGQDALTGQTGVVFIDALGAGVKSTPSSGSKEISGGGGHQDEALNFALSMPVVTDTVMITLTQFDLDKASNKKASRKSSKKSSNKASKKKASKKKASKKSKKKGDDGFVYVGSPPMLVLRDQIFQDALTPVPGMEDTFVLTLPDAVALAYPTLDFLSIRATDGHFLVSSFKAVPIPEPTTFGLFGMGMVGLGLARTRRSRTRFDSRGVIDRVAGSNGRPCRPAALPAAPAPRP